MATSVRRVPNPLYVYSLTTFQRPHNWTSFDIAHRAVELDAADPTSPAYASAPHPNPLSPLATVPVTSPCGCPCLHGTLIGRPTTEGGHHIGVCNAIPKASCVWRSSATPLHRTTRHVLRAGAPQAHRHDLGVLFDINGRQVPQVAATKLRLQQVCNILIVQRTVENAAVAATISTVTRAADAAHFSPWLDQDLTDIANPLNNTGGY